VHVRRWVLAAVVALALASGTACEAPLEPESDKSPASPSAGQQPSPASPAPPSTSKAPGGTRPVPMPSAPPEPASPSITVPEGLRPSARAKDRVVLGGDAGWPQCPKGMGIPQKRSQGSPMPLPQARYVILGLTNGPGFHPNPCLADQVAWVKQRRLLAAAYSVISWPDAATLSRHGGQGPYDGGTRAGALANVGYQQARSNLATMRAAGLQSPVIWLDVEPVPDFEWSSDTAANAAVVKGAARGYQDAGFPIGAYSTQYLWKVVVGDLRLGIAEWRAAGQTSRREALERCGPAYSFQGGPSVLSQWVEAGRDQDVTCPGTALAMTRWFHQY
jgi:hypothetical protein